MLLKKLQNSLFVVSSICIVLGYIVGVVTVQQNGSSCYEITPRRSLVSIPKKLVKNIETLEIGVSYHLIAESGLPDLKCQLIDSKVEVMQVYPRLIVQMIALDVNHLATYLEFKQKHSNHRIQFSQKNFSKACHPLPQVLYGV